MRLTCALWLMVTAVTLPAAHAQPGKAVKVAKKNPYGCESLCAELFASIRGEPQNMIMRLEEALVINEACSAEIVTTAIDAVNADPALVDKIVKTALDVVPQRASVITAAVRNYAAIEVAAAIPVTRPNATTTPAPADAAVASAPEAETGVEIRRAELPDFARPSPPQQLQTGPVEEVRRAELPLERRSIPVVEVRRAEAVPSGIPFVEPTAMPLPKPQDIRLLNVPKARPMKTGRRR